MNAIPHSARIEVPLDRNRVGKSFFDLAYTTLRAAASMAGEGDYAAAVYHAGSAVQFILLGAVVSSGGNVSAQSLAAGRLPDADNLPSVRRLHNLVHDKPTRLDTAHVGHIAPHDYFTSEDASRALKYTASFFRLMGRDIVPDMDPNDICTFSGDHSDPEPAFSMM